MNIMKLKKKIVIPLAITFVFLLVIFGYVGWNSANPQSSCGSCHEISPSVETSLTSSHRNIDCAQCHGTALSNGIHSLGEKVNMFFTHIGDESKSQKIRMNESQIVEIMMRCEGCHQTQNADWESGGHSVTYAQIFLDEKHNNMERPYWDCFRCHGMFYRGNIYDLMEPVDNKGPWHLKDPKQADMPAIPCLACHQIHSKNEVRKPAQAYEDPKNIFYQRDQRNIPFGLYLRADQIFLRADYLSTPVIIEDENTNLAPTELDYKLCVQCHSPNYVHEAGSEDDRTPRGVHEGLTCNSCHKVHSNDARNSCGNCHPAISNCELDVTKMNTSYLSAKSPNNIHSVDCVDCHPKMKSKS